MMVLIEEKPHIYGHHRSARCKNCIEEPAGKALAEAQGYSLLS